MIYYGTKETLARYKLATPEQMSVPMNEIAKTIVAREKGNRLYEWGCKLFYFDRRKCLQVVHFASKLTIFLVNLKMDDIVYAGNAVAEYIFDIYGDDKKMKCALERYFKSAPVVIFDKITDKSTISTLNKTQRDWAWDGYRFYDYIKDGILHTKKINKDVNRKWLFTRKIDGKTEYFYSAELFAEIIQKEFGD